MPLINRAEYVRRQIENAQKRLLKGHPLGASLAAYLNGDSFNQLGPNSRLCYIRDLTKFTSGLDHGHSPTEGDLREFLVRSKDDGFRPATLRRMDASIRHFLKAGSQEGVFLPNTSRSAALSKRERSRDLTVDDVSRLLDKAQSASSTRDAGIVAVAAGAGPTGDQIVALNPGDVLAANGNVWVTLGIPRPRIVSLASPYGEILTAHAQTRKPEDPLFRRSRIDRNGNLPLTFGGLSLIFNQLGLEIDWPSLNARDFRRFFIRQHKPTSAAQVAKLLGVTSEQAHKVYKSIYKR